MLKVSEHVVDVYDTIADFDAGVFATARAELTVVHCHVVEVDTGAVLLYFVHRVAVRAPREVSVVPWVPLDVLIVEILRVVDCQDEVNAWKLLLNETERDVREREKWGGC